MARSLVLGFAVLLLSSPGAAGIMGGSDEYLVIVNETDSELVVRYRVGEFAGPDFEQYVMMNKPMRSPGARYTRIRKYWPLTDDQIMLEGDILTLSISPNTGMIVGGIWRGGGLENTDALAGTPYLEIDLPEATLEYDGAEVFSAFARHSKDLRMLVVE